MGNINIMPLNARCIRCHTPVNEYIADLYVDWGGKDEYHPNLYMICKNISFCEARQKKWAEETNPLNVHSALTAAERESSEPKSSSTT